MTLIREVIDVPESVSQADFVVGLSEAVANSGPTIHNYVVTPSLADNFDKSLGLVAHALETGRSQAAFLHGSFGSGKSHFMAVLHQLLKHDPDARGIEDLGSAVAKHDKQLQGKKFLTLTYHLIGATSLEEAVLGGYLTQIRRLEPEAPLPGVHKSEKLLENADLQRERDGDETFFAGLNEAAGEVDSKWGKLASAVDWEAASYQAARVAEPTDADRQRLVSDLVRAYFPVFESSTDFVDLDTGLAAISRHAAGLGYDAVVLFLDELILWLASHLSDREFVTNEGAKTAKLVEAQDSQRDIPLVSLIARQRDLVDFLGTHVPGAEKASFAEVFSWARGRFDTIRLEDSNLPMIAERRLLRPKDDAAKATLDAAFTGIDRRTEVWDVLLEGSQYDGTTLGSDAEAFRRTYPFSPALVATLMALSQALQRERTALKVMLRLLVDQREELEVGDLVPVGDLFDLVVTDDVQTVTPDLQRSFSMARKLYDTKLRPALLDLHNFTDEQAQQQEWRSAFRTDDRLVKTLLLAALVPDVPALRGLTASRLAALNHGTVKGLLRGQEGQVVLDKMRKISAVVGELRIGDGADPLLSVELVEVDYESVLERVRTVDNEGNRRRALRELVWEALGVKSGETLDGVQTHSSVWRGKPVVVDLFFGNVRDTQDVPDSQLLAVDGRWRVVIDYPFDAQGYGPAADRARVEDLVERDVESRTAFWLPLFLTTGRQSDLGDYVLLHHLLSGTGERFQQNADNLSPSDREQARQMLQSRYKLMKEKLVGVLKQAYGLAKASEADVDLDAGHDRVFATLEPGLQLSAPVGATLADGLHSLLDQLLTSTWPQHPRFEPGDTPVRAVDLTRVLDYAEQTMQDIAHRAAVDKPERAAVKRIVGPLEAGRMSEAHYILNDDSFPWVRRFAQAASGEGLKDVYPVARLRAWADGENGARGLDRPVSNLLISLFALHQDLAWYRAGVAVEPPSLTQITDEHELRPPRLPDESQWDAAVERARDVLGVQVPPLRSAANLAKMYAGVTEAARRDAPGARELDRLLSEHVDELGLDMAATTGRLATARAVAALLDSLVEINDPVELGERLADVDLPAATPVLRRSLETATDLNRVLTYLAWPVIRLLGSVAADRSDAAKALQNRLADAARRDELEIALSPVLPKVVAEAEKLVAGPAPTPEPPGPGPTDEVGTVDVAASDIEGAVEKLREFAQQHEDATIRVDWRTL